MSRQAGGAGSQAAATPAKSTMVVADEPAGPAETAHR
jgi:hypothetical protein